MFGIGNNQKGILIVEVLVAIAIIGIALASLLGLASFSLQVSTLVKESTRATNLAQETIEAVRSIRDAGWTNISDITMGSLYHPEIDNSSTTPQWKLVSGTGTVDIFIRQVVISNGMRNLSGNIDDSGGINDPNTKKVTVTVLWKGKQVEIVTYLTKWNQ